MLNQIEIAVEVDADTYAWLLAKYSDDQPRDEAGRWSAVPGAGTHHSRPNEHKAGPVKIKSTRERAFHEQPVPCKIKLTNKETDKITEAVVIQHLRAQGFKDAEVAATVAGYKGGNNYAVDVYADHQAIELKGGSIANGKGAQQWRVKYGQESKQFSAWAKTADPDDVRAMRNRFSTKCLKDKEKARQWLEKDRGKKCAAVTYTAIINPDKRHVDIYRFKGYHLRLGWMSSEDAYLKSYKY